jgi:hypothetical protein
MLSAQQRQFFETFGYLHLRGAIAADVGWISDEFHAGWKSQGVEHDGTKHTGYPGIMISSTPRLSTLLDHAAVVGALDDLLGQGWSCYGGDGNFYYGDTQWHSDVHPGTVSEKGITRHIKIAFYLDAIRLDTGCLRVIPGSHLGGDRYSTLVQDGLCGGAPLGLSGRDVPAAALETDPGDLVVFDHRLKHAAFGGGNARRMFTINAFGPCPTEREREAMRVVMRIYRDQAKVDWLARPKWRDWIDTLSPTAQLRFVTTLALGAEVMSEAAALSR